MLVSLTHLDHGLNPTVDGINPPAPLQQVLALTVGIPPGDRLDQIAAALTKLSGSGEGVRGVDLLEDKG